LVAFKSVPQCGQYLICMPPPPALGAMIVNHDFALDHHS
jgi:hypothetical protein